MAKVILPVNFQDDIINQDMNGKRRYNMITNSDGTVSFEDVTVYDQIGSNYGANQVNSTNEAVNQSADANKILDNIDDINANTQSGYIAGALAVKELNSKISYDFTNAKYLMGTANAVRRGNVVTITYTGDWKGGTPANNIGTIATLPENFIPAVRCQTMCAPFNDIQIIIDTSGNILAHNYGSAIATQSAGRFLLTYVAKD